MKDIRSKYRIPAILLVFLIAGCAKSDDQKQFEEEAFRSPEHYTETDINAETGNTDPDDWRISPMYQGLITVSAPAYPNPVLLNSTFRIDMHIHGIESIPGMEIFVFDRPDQMRGPVGNYPPSSLTPGIHTFILDTALFSSTGSSRGLYRVLIFDGRENMITYGDVLVE